MTTGTLIIKACFVFAVASATISCSTSRFAKARAELTADAALLAEETSQEPEQLATAKRVPDTPATNVTTPPAATKVAVNTSVAPQKAGPAIQEIEKPVPLKKSPAPAIVTGEVSSPTSEEKSAALLAEKANLTEAASIGLQKQKFNPSPYFTLFTKTNEAPAPDSPEASTAEE